MAKHTGQRRRPTTGAKDERRAQRPVLIENLFSADGFFRADEARPANGRGPGNGAGAFIEAYA